MKKILRKSPFLYRFIRAIYLYFKGFFHLNQYLCSREINLKFFHLNYLITSDILPLYKFGKYSITFFLKNYKNLNENNLKALSSYLSMTGKHQLSLILLKFYNTVKIKNLKKSELDSHYYRFFDAKNFGAIGHIAFIDFYIKSDKLSNNVSKKNVFIDENKYFSNSTLIQMYENDFIRPSHLKINKNSQISEELGLMKNDKQEYVWLDEWAWDIQKRWIKIKGKKTAYKLDDQAVIFAKNYLKAFGLTDKDWFVVIHIREDGGGQMRGLRNADARSYKGAIENIIKRGGWVLRIGGNSLSKDIPIKSKKYIDLTKSKIIIPEVDSYVLSKCKFFIGTGSGPLNIAAHFFCRPVLLTNSSPLASRVPWIDQLVLPKMYVNINTKKIMPFSKRLNKIFGILESEFALKSLGYKAIPNSQEEILYASNEMIKLTSNTHFDNKSLNSNIKQIRFKKISTQNGKLCPIFCSEIIFEKYPEFLS
jgi:putative glycosyltransferase (TIGR04372 family)